MATTPSRTAEPRFSLRIPSHPTPEQLRFVRQLGVGAVYTWVGDDQRSPESLKQLKQTVNESGLELYNVGSMTVAKSPQIHLGLSGRDERIEEFARFIRALGQAGIGVTTFTWEPDQVWSSPRGETRAAPTRAVDLADLSRHGLTHGREYTREELWANFAYLMERLMPVAEESGVRLALHPNDPPTESLGGVPCLIRSAADYRRAFEIAASPALGMEFCTGCWLEGGDAFGDVEAGLREFAADDRILVVHFRNVSAPLPRFVETFLDNGYADMYRLMRILHEADYHGSVSLDHTPTMAAPGGREAGVAYAIGYMRALSERARDELAAGENREIP